MRSNCNFYAVVENAIVRLLAVSTSSESRQSIKKRIFLFRLLSSDLRFWILSIRSLEQKGQKESVVSRDIFGNATDTAASNIRTAWRHRGDKSAFHEGKSVAQKAAAEDRSAWQDGDEMIGGGNLCLGREIPNALAIDAQLLTYVCMCVEHVKAPSSLRVPERKG